MSAAQPSPNGHGPDGQGPPSQANGERKAPAAVVDRVTFGYEPSSISPPALEDVSLRIESDDFLALVGPNAGGKTTLVRVLLGLLRPASGSVQVFGRPPREVRRFIGYVPQHAAIDISFPANVLDLVLMGRLSSAPAFGRYRPRDVAAAHEALDRVGVADLGGRRLGSLSGGQRQRVLIARALASDARLLVLDEPTASVDSRMERNIYELLHRLNADEHLPIVLVTHDVAYVSAHVKHVACLNRRLVSHTAGEVPDEAIAQMYEGHGPVHALRHDHEWEM